MKLPAVIYWINSWFVLAPQKKSRGNLRLFQTSGEKKRRNLICWQCQPILQTVWFFCVVVRGQLSLSLSCPSVFTHVSACEIIVVIQFLGVLFFYLITHFKARTWRTYMDDFPPSLFFPPSALNCVQTFQPFSLPLASHPSCHSSFSSRFYPMHFTVSVLNVDK